MISRLPIFYKTILSRVILVLGIVLCTPAIGQEIAMNSSKRGVVVYPSDLISFGITPWIDLLEKNGLNLLGVHTDTRLETLPELKSFLTSSQGQLLLEICEKKGIGIEYELHVLQDILPRSLFKEHPEYFRMDKSGQRQEKYNMCFTSTDAYNEIEKQVVALTQWLRPTTHRYFFWTDDVQDAFCHCDNCSPYSPSEQALIYENKLVDILRKIDSTAQVAHLAYNNTLQPPKKVKPAAGVFLEYAPISRNYEKGLRSADHFTKIEENLQVFPKETAHILEYWLDVSMFSNWKKDALVKLPWNKTYFERDVKDYRSLGIPSITSFAAWINRDYQDLYGMKHINGVLQDYGDILNEVPRFVIDGQLDDWDKKSTLKGLTNPWGTPKKDNTLFDYKVENGFFYFYFKTADKTPVHPKFLEELSVADADRVELFFSPHPGIVKILLS